jgi:nucleoid-associated protein YgaU
MRYVWKKSSLWTLLFCVSLIVGCSGRTAYLDRREERDPDVKKALVKKKGNDIEGAIKYYQKALDRKSTMALPHLELGILFDDQKKDYVRAIYHYQRYLELRPNVEEKKIDIVKRLIKFAELSFAASLPDRPSSAVEQIASLQKENDLLKEQFNELRNGPGSGSSKGQANKGTNRKPYKPSRSDLVGAEAPAKKSVQKYLVQSGDTLSRIAKKMYNDPEKADLIYRANRNVLKSRDALKIGETLIIPQ